jgi:hypothetical protein
MRFYLLKILSWYLRVLPRSGHSFAVACFFGIGCLIPYLKSMNNIMFSFFIIALINSILVFYKINIRRWIVKQY